MRDYYVPYPGLTTNFNIDPELNIPNTYFKLITFDNDITSDDIQALDQKPQTDDFTFEIFKDSLTFDTYDLKLEMRSDYKNYFSYIIVNKQTNNPTFLTETTHRPEYNIQINKTKKICNIKIYDFNLKTKFIKQEVFIDFTNKTIIYTNPIVRSY